MFKGKQLDKQMNKTERNIISHFDPKSPIAEQYRTLRTNIQFSSMENGLQTILVSSSSPGEGKSTTVANLSVVLAQQGKKVLLVDADLRKPTVHYTFSIDNRNGLTNVLSGQAKRNAVEHKTLVPNLMVVPSGPIPPNPSELLSSSQMGKVIEEWKEEYDYILFDTPPILAVADAQVLANSCDGSILVISSGKADRQDALKAKEQLMQAKAKLLGAVLNEKPKEDSTYYYYYGEKK